MSKFHINVSTGAQGRCKADKKPCPFGETGLHFDSEERAKEYSFLAPRERKDGVDLLVSEEQMKADQIKLAQLVKDGDHVGLNDFILERSQKEEFKAALAQRDEYREILAEYDELNSILTNPVVFGTRSSVRIVNLVDAEGEVVGLVDARLAAKDGKELGLTLVQIDAHTEPPTAQFVDLDEHKRENAYAKRELSLVYRDVYEEHKYLGAQMDEYRLISAQAALAASKLREEEERANGTFLEYTDNKLGVLEEVGSFESNTDEWHAARAAGIGGSDVGTILRTNPVKEYADEAFKELDALKLGIPLEQDPTKVLDGTDLRSAVGRGNAWEENIRQKVADNNPDENIAFCKTSWRNSEKPHRLANFDGLMLDKDGNPDGIVEIKTSSNPKDWGDVSEGLDGVPEAYKAQVLWYASNAGLKRGMVAAVIDDSEYREYKFSMDDPAIQEYVAKMNAETDAYWEDLTARKKALESGLAPHKKAESRRGMYYSTSSPDKVAEVYAAYADIPLEESKAIFRSRLGGSGKGMSDSEFHEIASEIFASHDPSKATRNFVGIDIETTGQSPRSGRIIETGIAIMTPDGKTELVYDSRHDIPKKAYGGVGVGRTDIHKLDKKMITGKPQFDTPEVQKKVLDYLKSGTMVAHHAQFEDAWLSTNVPGYLEAKHAGEIKILDTKILANYLMPKSANSKLETFSKDNGIPYEGAHAAAKDTLMMLEALNIVQKDLHKHGRTLKRTYTEEQRAESARIAAEVQKARGE